MTTRAQPIWFGDPGRQLFGWLHLPADGHIRGAVVLCPPMGEEGRSAHRTFRALAESLSERGIAALRFDYDGTGDSAGAQTDPGRVAAWLGSVRTAHHHLATLTQLPTALLGMRLGAVLVAYAAHEIAASGGPVPQMVLWDPCNGGKSFLREGQALHLVSLERELVADDLVHTPGFQYSVETKNDLGALDLARLPTTPIADAVLLLTRPDRPLSKRVRRSLDADPALTEVSCDDQHLLMDLLPSDCIVPQSSLTRVVDWLAEQMGADEASPTVDVPAVSQAAMSWEGHDLVERVHRFASTDLFAIATEPTGPTRPPWLVFINVAVEHHIGPGRRWVDYSRHLATLGFRCLRFDLSGVGDSPNHDGQADDELFSPWWIDDMQALVHELGRDGSPVCLVGLCSGAHNALEVAMWQHVDAIFGINPRVDLYMAAKGSPTYTAQRRVGVVPAAPIAKLAARHRRTAGGLWRTYRQLALWHAPQARLQRVARRNTVTRLLACPQDYLPFREVVLLRLFGNRGYRGRLELLKDERLDHSLLSLEAQQVMATELERFVRERYEERR